MAGTMRKMAVYLGLVEDQDRYGEYGEYTEYGDGEYDDVGAADRRTERGAGPPRESSVVPSGARRPVERVSAVRELDRITTLHPRTYNEARTIGEHFREGTPVIMNLTEMDDGDAKRLVDFAAGANFLGNACVLAAVVFLAAVAFLAGALAAVGFAGPLAAGGVTLRAGAFLAAGAGGHTPLLSLGAAANDITPSL